LYVTDVICDPLVFGKSKIHPSIIEKIRKKLMNDPRVKPPKAKRMWLEVVSLDQELFHVTCREEEEKIVITKVCRAKKKKVRAREF
jgi:hypothetical protein